MVIFRLREGAEPEAEKLVAAGPPVDLEKTGFRRFAAYLSHHEVIFVFEGEEPLWREDDLVNDFLQPALRERLDEWRKLADVHTWPASPIFVWEASAAG
jgi:hypothetical protein